MVTIGIAGGTGCGKTTVVNQIIEQLPAGEVGIISQDSYYKDLSHLSYEARCEINFDHPSTIDFELLEQHLKLLKSGKPIDQPIYSFAEHNRTADTLRTHPQKGPHHRGYPHNDPAGNQRSLRYQNFCTRRF